MKSLKNFSLAIFVLLVLLNCNFIKSTTTSTTTNFEIMNLKKMHENSSNINSRMITKTSNEFGKFFNNRHMNNEKFQLFKDFNFNKNNKNVFKDFNNFRFKAVNSNFEANNISNKSNLNKLTNLSKSKLNKLSEGKSGISHKSVTKISSKSKSKILSKGKSKNKNKKQSDAAIWPLLFNGPKDENCNGQFDDDRYGNGKLKKDGESVYLDENSWIKKWGYGSTAYLIDYLDPIYMKDMVNDYQRVFEETLKFDLKDNDLCEDVFNLHRLDPSGTITDLKKLNPNYVQGIYEKSLNMVQIDQAFRQWGWHVEAGKEKEVAKTFVLTYDLNGDGRLNARELVLGIITHHKDRKVLCYNCFSLLKKKLKSMFEYFDCDNNNFITAENMWNTLPQVSRGTNKYNLFSIDNENNIRLDAVNDFIIKNGYVKKGYVNSEEFINGILLAYWDRQTSFKGVLNDDSQNLKKLRWDSAQMVDKVAFQYMKDREVAKKIAEEERQKDINYNAQLAKMRAASQ